MTRNDGRTVMVSADNAGNGVFLEFVHQADRFGHRMGDLVEGLPGATLLTSIEGTPNADDSLSVPALQELSISPLPDGRTARMLLGMSGANHWSLTVEDDVAADRPRITLDYACRARDCPAALGNRYAIPPDVDVVRVDSGLLLTGVSHQVQLRLCSMAGWPETEARVSGRELQVVCNLPANNTQLATIRWRYVVELDS